jgi:hypothetical protein
MQHNHRGRFQYDTLYSSAMAETRPKRVTIDDSDQLNPLVLQNYSKLATALKKRSGLPENVSSMISEAQIAALITALRNAMEATCGKDAPKPRPITKFPMVLFQDFAVGGAIDVIVSVVCNEVATNGGTLADAFTDRTRAAKLLVATEKELVAVRLHT